MKKKIQLTFIGTLTIARWIIIIYACIDGARVKITNPETIVGIVTNDDGFHLDVLFVGMHRKWFMLVNVISY